MDDNEGEKRRPFTPEQWKLVSLILVIGLAGLIYHSLVRIGGINSAALYIGLPILVALGVALTRPAKTITGTSLKVMTILLLLSGPVLGEGFICILMAAPILYAVVIVVAIPIDYYNKKKAKRQTSNIVKTSMLSVLLALSALEGTHESLTFERYNEVSYSKIINADIISVRQKLAQIPVFEQAAERPIFMRLFPMPTSVTGSGLAIGDTRKIHFVYNKWVYFNAHEGDLILRVTESDSNHIRFDIPYDDSYISKYLSWEKSEIFLEEISENRTRVTWKLGYNRDLDPMWYFGPMQNYAAGLTAQMLVDNVADPTY